MALESTTYISGLVVTNPTSSDNISDGDNHIRLLKSTVKATFPNLTGAVTGTQGAINTAVSTANAATNANTASAIVKRDSSGNFSAGTVTAALTGNVNGNAATATALATSRSIALAGDLSGSANFNGTSNISISAVVADDSHNHVIGNIDGLSTQLAAKAPVSTTLTTSTGFGGDVSGAYNAIVVANDSHTHDTRYFTESEADARFLGINAVPQSALTATHSTNALQWTNARTLTLTGDASGSVTVRGNANMSLSVAVANDSHTHNSLYYTETEMNSLLAGKLGSTATAAAATYAASAGNSNTVDGYHISTSASGSSANTIYFRT